MKIGCGTVVFREYELEKVFDAIRNIGFEYCETQGVGPWCQHVDIYKTDPVWFADLAKKYGFSGVTALWMPNGNIISNEKSVESAIRALQWADAAGIPVVNTGDGHKPAGMTDDEAFEILKQRFDMIFDKVPDVKAKLAIEPHGTFSLTLEGLNRIMSLAPESKLGINFDGANIHRSCYVESGANGSGWKAGEHRENEKDVLEGVVSRVVHCHAKDLDASYNCTALGEGEVMLKDCIGILKNAGYDGVISLETEGGMPFDESVKLAEKSFKFLKETLNRE